MGCIKNELLCWKLLALNTKADKKMWPVKSFITGHVLTSAQVDAKSSLYSQHQIKSL